MTFLQTQQEGANAEVEKLVEEIVEMVIVTLGFSTSKERRATVHSTINKQTIRLMFQANTIATARKIMDGMGEEEEALYGMETTYGDTEHPHPSVVYGRNTVKEELTKICEEVIK